MRWATRSLRVSSPWPHSWAPQTGNGQTMGKRAAAAAPTGICRWAPGSGRAWNRHEETAGAGAKVFGVLPDFCLWRAAGRPANGREEPASTAMTGVPAPGDFPDRRRSLRACAPANSFPRRRAVLDTVLCVSDSKVGKSGRRGGLLSGLPLHAVVPCSTTRALGRAGLPMARHGSS